MTAELLPWLAPAWQRCEKQITSGTLPHALLLAGPASSGKSMLADAIVSRSICSEPGSPCGSCHQCQLLEAGTHPDYRLVTLEDSKQILIDQVRDVIEWANQTAQQGGRKICILNPADCLNTQSANALLKCLEEPPGGTGFILLSDKPQQLLPTIRSRCQLVLCPAPGTEEALAWLNEHNTTDIASDLLLEIAGGVPLKAVELVDDDFLDLRGRLATCMKDVFTAGASPIQFSATFAKDDPEQTLDILYELTADTICYSMQNRSLKNRDLADELSSFANTGLRVRFEFLDRISKAKDIVSGTSNANQQMLLEWVLSG